MERGCKLSPTDNRDWVLEKLIPMSVNLPPKVDLRKYLPIVRDQGNKGTCTAQAASCMKEYHERIDIGLKGHLSPMFVYSRRENAPEDGMWPRDAMKILQKDGIVREEMSPYYYDDVYKLDGDFKIKNYAQIESVQGMKEALFTQGPCIIAVPSWNDGKEMWIQGESDKFLFGHAMAVVGYDDTKQHFILRNSWGDNWGDKGYCYMKYEDFKYSYECWSSVDLTGGKKVSWIANLWWYLMGTWPLKLLVPMIYR